MPTITATELRPMVIYNRVIPFLLAFVAVSIAFGQTAVQPGQLAVNASLTKEMSLRPPIPAIAPAVLPNRAVTNASTEAHDRFVRRFWIASVFAMAAGTATDAVTSWGYRESNGVLASSNGSFGARGAGIKLGMVSALVVPQVLLHRHKDLRMKFAIGNLAEAGIFAGTSVHNLHVAGSQQP